LPVIATSRSGGIGIAFLEKEIQWSESSLHVSVPNHDVVVVNFYNRSGVAEKFIEERRLKSFARDAQMLELVRLNQTSSEVMFDNNR
jgi:hypothetical protein